MACASFGGVKLRSLSELSVEHEAPVHVIVVSYDLGYFAHIHPEAARNASGRYSLDYAFPAKGDYVIYVEFALPGKADEVHRFDLPVGGGGSPLAVLVPDMSPRQVGDYTATIKEIEGAESKSFTVHIEQNRQPVTDLQPYLGAAAHVVTIDEKTGSFGHAHAVPGTEPMHEAAGEMEEVASAFGPDIAFSPAFGGPGLYKMWVQFEHQGQVQTVPWVVEVK